MFNPDFHIFSHHLLQRQHNSMLPATNPEPFWQSIFLVICLGILIWVRLNAMPRMVRVLQSTFSSQVLQQLEREETGLFRIYSLAINFLFVLSLSFLLYKLNGRYSLVLIGSPGLTQFMLFVAIVVSLAIVRGLVNRLIAHFTGNDRLISDYMVSSLLLNQTFALLLFPCVVLIEFASYGTVFFLWLAVGLVGIMLVLRWYRGLVMGLSDRGVGLLQILSYFCGLEILPVLVLAKFVVETF